MPEAVKPEFVQLDKCDLDILNLPAARAEYQRAVDGGLTYFSEEYHLGGMTQCLREFRDGWAWKLIYFGWFVGRLEALRRSKHDRKVNTT